MRSEISTGALCSAPIMDFPPCETEQQISAAEFMLLAMFPNLKAFCRDLTPWELKQGMDRVADADGVMVIRSNDSKIDWERRYGRFLSRTEAAK